MANKNLKRLKFVLAEQKKTAKWLAEQSNVGFTTVSKWCTNARQSDWATLKRISALLGINVSEIINFD